MENRGSAGRLEEQDEPLLNGDVVEPDGDDSPAVDPKPPENDVDITVLIAYPSTDYPSLQGPPAEQEIGSPSSVFADDASHTNSVRALMMGGGAPTQGTRQRIRTRIATPLDDVGSECEEELLQGGFADGLLVSENEVQEFRTNAWQPSGKGVPLPGHIRLGYHAAWDIGKKGCVGMKLRNTWESAVNPNRLRFFIMDGTDPLVFLSVYGRNDLKNLAGPDGKKGVVCAPDVRDATWDYPSGRLTLHRSDKSGKLMVIDKLPQLFINAMIVCIREMEVARHVHGLRLRRLEERRTQETRVAKRRYGSRLSVIQGPERAPSVSSYLSGGSDNVRGSRSGGQFLATLTEHRKSVNEAPLLAIGATRYSAKALVSPNSSVLASVVQHMRKEGDVFPGAKSDERYKPRTRASGGAEKKARPRRLRFNFGARQPIPASHDQRSVGGPGGPPSVPMIAGHPAPGLTLGARAPLRKPSSERP